jgi:RNase adaptor protein for sRNA GlmZ degradation
MATLYTCGYKRLGLKIPYQFKSIADFKLATERAIKESLIAQGFVKANVFNLDSAIHCINLGDPAKQDKLKGCWGENATTLQAFLKNEKSRDILIAHLQRLKNQAMAWTKTKPAGDDKFRAALMCSKGRHRCVALALFARWCLEDSKFELAHTVHVNSDGWGNLCTTCQQCGAGALIKKDIKTQAIDIWRALKAS